MVKRSASSVWAINRGDKEKRLKNGDKKKAVKAAEHAANVSAKAAKSAAVLVTKKSDTVNKLF